MTDKNWKRFERRVAKALGGERIPVADRRSPLDVTHPRFGIECKYRNKLSKFITDAMQQAVDGTGKDKLPLVALGAKGDRQILVMLRLDDFIQLIGSENDVA